MVQRFQIIRRTAISLVLATVPAVEHIACKGGDDMAIVATQSNAKQRAAEAMEKLPFEKARSIVFAILAEDLSEQTRFDIMQSFVDRYKGKALEEIRKQVLLAGRSPEDFSQLRKTNLRRFRYMKTLAYGLARFGEQGFETAVQLVRAGAGMRMPFSSEEYLLLHGIATTATYMMLHNKLIDPAKAVERLHAEVEDGEVALPEKGLFIRWAVRINPRVASEWQAAVADDPALKRILELHRENSVRDSVPSRR